MPRDLMTQFTRPQSRQQRPAPKRTWSRIDCGLFALAQEGRRHRLQGRRAARHNKLRPYHRPAPRDLRQFVLVTVKRRPPIFRAVLVIDQHGRRLGRAIEVVG